MSNEQAQELIEVLKEQNKRLLEIEKNLNDLKNILRFWSNSSRKGI